MASPYIFMPSLGPSAPKVAGLHGDSLKLRLASPPVDGKANECLIAFLALRLGVKRAQVSIVRGAELAPQDRVCGGGRA